MYRLRTQNEAALGWSAESQRKHGVFDGSVFHRDHGTGEMMSQRVF